MGSTWLCKPLQDQVLIISITKRHTVWYQWQSATPIISSLSRLVDIGDSGRQSDGGVFANSNLDFSIKKSNIMT